MGDLIGPQIRLYDVSTAELIGTLAEPLGQDSPIGVWYVSFSPDGGLFAATASRVLVVWDTDTWEAVHVVEPPEGEIYYGAEFTPDGQKVAVGVASGGVELVDLATGEVSPLATGTENPGGVYHVNTLEFTEDGEYVIIALAGVTLVHTESGQSLGLPIPSSEIGWPSIAAGGGYAVTGTEEHLLVWDLDIDSWPDVACLAAGRNMTADEWEQFGPAGEPYQATCPQWPALA